MCWEERGCWRRDIERSNKKGWECLGVRDKLPATGTRILQYISCAKLEKYWGDE